MNLRQEELQTMHLSLSDVFRTVEDALATGQAGVPVSARMQWSIRAAAEAPAVAASLLSRLSSLFRSSLSRVMVQQHISGEVLNVLATLVGGQTISLSLFSNPAAAGSENGTSARAADLLVVGNHGVIRLEGDSADFSSASDLHGNPPEQPEQLASFPSPGEVEAALRQSLQSNSAVKLA